VYIKLVVLLRNYVTMMHGQQNIKNGWATIVVVGRLRVKAWDFHNKSLLHIIYAVVKHELDSIYWIQNISIGV
jgi:hypothetical protein